MPKSPFRRAALNLVEHPVRMTLMLSVPVTLVFCALIAAFTLWNRAETRRDLMLTLAESGRAYFN